MEARSQEVPEARQVSRDEVLPHPYGTYQIHNARAAESGHGETDADRWEHTPEPESGRLGRAGVDSKQFSSCESTPPLCSAATSRVARKLTPPPDRGGDCPGESMGQEIKEEQFVTTI